MKQLIFAVVPYLFDTLDYIGNVVIQKMMDKGTDSHRLCLIQNICPRLASLGTHKNGTWAVQKIIESAKTPIEFDLIVDALRPYAGALLLDQFGNYVIQCCLRLGSERNQFIFDAMSRHCWEIGQGRFGARAMKACLESQHTTKRQQKQVCHAIAQNCLQLSTNTNGSILITWLCDLSSLPGRYRVLATKFEPHLVVMSCHKLSSGCIIKLGMCLTKRSKSARGNGR